MKNKFISLLSIVSIFIIFSSCKKTNDVQKLVNTPMTSDQMFEKISNENIDLEKGKALIVNYEYDNRTGMCKIIDFKQATPENSILNDNKSMYELKGREKALSYTVKCDFAKKKDWTKTCDGVYSCGGLIDDCLKAGGCATICQNKLVYTSNTKVFYVDGSFSSPPTSI